MGLDKEYLKKIWDSIWEENLSEMEVQRKYFAKLDKELKGEDRFHLIAVGRKIDELEMNIPFSNLLEKREDGQNRSNLPIELKDARTEGDGTEWIIEKDKKGKLFKRAIGSHEKIYLEDK
mgnify:CR=1 FL=1